MSVGVLRMLQTRGLVLILLVMCLWLGILTHYALSVVEEEHSHQNRIHPAGNPPAQENEAIVSSTPSTDGSSLSLREKMLNLQLSVLRRKVTDAQMELSSATASLKEELHKREAELLECKAKNRKFEEAAAAQPDATSKTPSPPAMAPPPTAPFGLNAYEQEQWRIRQYQRDQRADMLRERRNFVEAHRSPDGSATPPPPQEVPRGGSTVGQSVGLAVHVDRLMGNVRTHGPIIPVVVVAYQRADVLKKCIETILRRMPSVGFQLIASQDGREFPEVTSVLDEFHRRGKLIHMIHARNTSGGTEEEYAQGWEPYFAISHHFQFFLQEVFSIRGYERVIIVEEDIEVGVDFFDYMTATSPLLDVDPTLYCVSAWNDNGKAALIADPRAVYRTDFFPGLGWMMARALWVELEPVWPKGFWDDWLRQPAHRRGRSCLRPEVPRSFTWCTAEGVSQGQFCAEHLANIKLADTAVNWKSLDLSVLVKDSYDAWLDGVIHGATEVHSVDELDRIDVAPHQLERMPPGPLGMMPTKDVKLYYHTNQEYEHLAQLLQLMDDFKDDVPRTAYKGIVTFRRRNVRVHLVPTQPLYR